MLCILKCTVLQLHVTQVFALILRGIPSEKSSLLLLLVNSVGGKLCETSLEADICIYSYSLGARLKAAGSKNKELQNIEATSEDIARVGVGFVFKTQQVIKL